MRPVAIVGGGASGLMAAAAAAARLGPGTVLLLEKEARVGRKLLATGNGRCNLLNLCVDAARYHGGGAPVAVSLLKKTPPEALLHTFEGLGLAWREDADGRVYPRSGQAGAVVDVLRAACDRYAVETVCDAEVTRIILESGGFSLHTKHGGAFSAREVVIAAGGKAAPAYGADGGAHRLLRSLGHTVTPLSPALTPLKVSPDAIRGLKGVRVHAALSLCSGGETLGVERGEALFADYGISGIAAMQLARRADEALKEGGRVSLIVHLLGEAEAAAQVARRCTLFAGEPFEAFFTGLLHKRVALCLLRIAGIAAQAPVMSEAAAPLAGLLCRWPLPVTGVLPFEHAQATAGGAKLDAFDPHSLASRCVPGLFACGEALDVDGDCGGYNLMWAWASALAVANAVGGSFPQP